jgi:hypothetical protein
MPSKPENVCSSRGGTRDFTFYILKGEIWAKARSFSQKILALASHLSLIV